MFDVCGNVVKCIIENPTILVQMVFAKKADIYHMNNVALFYTGEPLFYYVFNSFSDEK